METTFLVRAVHVVEGAGDRAKAMAAVQGRSRPGVRVAGTTVTSCRPMAQRPQRNRRKGK